MKPTLAEAIEAMREAVRETKGLEHGDKEWCSKCGEQHEFRTDGKYAGTWASPIDGHTLYRDRLQPIRKFLEAAGSESEDGS